MRALSIKSRACILTAALENNERMSKIAARFFESENRGDGGSFGPTES